MERKIHVFLGPPKTGKTEACATTMDEQDHKKVIRIARGEIASQAFIIADNDPLITSIHDMAIEKSLDKGYTVFIDDYNCKYAQFKKKLEYYLSLAKVELHFMEPRTATQIMSDITMPCSNTVVSQFVNDYYEVLTHQTELIQMCETQPIYQVIGYDDNLLDCVLIDIDGTLAGHTPEVRGPFEWDKVSRDYPIKDMIRTINALDSTVVRIFITGRDMSCQNQTYEWLEKHLIFNDRNPDYEPHLLMRPIGDFRAASIVKNELYLTHVRGKYNVIAAIDDDPRVMEMYERYGINTLTCKYDKE